MATLAEKLRACIALDGKAAAFVYVEAGRCLALDASDLTTIADALEENGDAVDTISTLSAELDAAKTEVAALRDKLEESVGVAEAVAWMGEHLAFTDSKVVAQRWSEEGKRVVALYRHPPAPEALPTREDLETVLRECLKISDLWLGVEELSLRECRGMHAVCALDEEVEDVEEHSFAEVVTKAAALLRGKKAGA